MTAIQSVTRGAIRRSILRNLGIGIIGVATTTTDATSLIDTKNLLGGDDEHIGKEVLIYETTDGAAPEDESSVVSAFTGGTTNDATLSPTLTAAITALDKYEMLTTPWRIADINDAIDQALMELTGRCLQIKEDSTLFTESNKYLYTIPSGFTHLGLIEYVYSRSGYHLVSDCETVWTKGSANVTVTLDSSFEKVGTYCMKAVEAGGSGAGAILCYIPISSLDISDSNKVEFWMYSSIALTAGQLQIHLSSTAIIASAEETIDIPAMTAATWYKHSLSLEAPHSDTAIISAGIYQVSDVGAFTFYVDQVETVDTFRELYKPIVDEYWDISRGSTNYLQLSSQGLSVVGTIKKLKLQGYQILTAFSTDASVSQVEPGFLIARVTERLLIAHAKSRYLDIQDKAEKARYWGNIADRRLAAISTTLMQGTREI